MGRLAVVLAVLAQPATTVAAWVLAFRAWPVEVPSWVPVSLFVSSGQIIVTSVFLLIAHSEKKLTRAYALRVAWGFVYYPARLAWRGVRWIATGETP